MTDSNEAGKKVIILILDRKYTSQMSQKQILNGNYI